MTSDATDGMTNGAAGFVTVTPAGCFHAIEDRPATSARETLFAVLRETSTPAVDSLDDTRRASLGTLTEAGLVDVVERPETLPSGNLGELLPSFLPALSERGRVVLTESRQGLFLDYVGVTAGEAEEIAVLASGLRATADRAAALLVDRLGIHSRAFGIVDPAGNSDIGFWPLHIGHNVFTLTILGIPRFNSPEFRWLVWALIERYGQTSDDPGSSTDESAMATGSTDAGGPNTGNPDIGSPNAVSGTP